MRMREKELEGEAGENIGLCFPLGILEYPLNNFGMGPATYSNGQNGGVTFLLIIFLCYLDLFKNVYVKCILFFFANLETK